MQVQKKPLKKYIAISATIYLPARFILSALLSMPVWYIGHTTVSLPLVVMIGFIAGYLFFKHNERASTVEENRRYAFHTLLWAILLPSFLLICALFAYLQMSGFDMVEFIVDMSKQPLLVPLKYFIALIFMLIGIMLHYVAIRWSFSWCTAVLWKRQAGEKAAL